MAKSKSRRSKVSRGGGRAPRSENAKPVKAGNSDFTRTAKRVHPMNHWVPMRGGIRF